MVRVESEKDALIQLVDDLLHRQAIDPGVQDPGTMPAPITSASRLNLRLHQRLKTRARSDFCGAAAECSDWLGAEAARCSIISIVRSVAAADAKSFRCGLPLAIASPKASSCALYSSPRR